MWSARGDVLGFIKQLGLCAQTPIVKSGSIQESNLNLVEIDVEGVKSFHITNGGKMDVERGTLFWLTAPEEVIFREKVDQTKYVYRLTAWPLPSWKGPLKFGVYIAPKQERKEH